MIKKNDKNIVYHPKFVRTQSGRKLLSLIYADCTFTYRKHLQ